MHYAVFGIASIIYTEWAKHLGRINLPDISDWVESSILYIECIYHTVCNFYTVRIFQTGSNIHLGMFYIASIIKVVGTFPRRW